VTPASDREHLWKLFSLSLSFLHSSTNKGETVRACIEAGRTWSLHVICTLIIGIKVSLSSCNLHRFYYMY
jgi:hypothetical protein